jgi:phage FluMu gp28-like protein
MTASTLPKGSPLHELTGPGANAPDAPPPVLLGYQKRWVEDTSQLKVAEKGRRIGLTWAEAADDVLIASQALGSNVFYISATQDMAKEYIEACAMWAKAYNVAASAIAEGLFADEGKQGEERSIKTYEITLPFSGHRIVALSSRPANLRGKQGVIVIDEAAFAPDLAGLIKAAMAMLMWGDVVRIISTHDGSENPFNQLIQEVRAGKRGRSAKVHTIPFSQAVEDGLYRRVCLRKGRAWTQKAEDDWVQDTRDFYADDAPEELDAIPSASGGSYLSLVLIEQRMRAWAPGALPAIVRGKWDDAFAWLTEDTRHHAVAGWLHEELDPLFELLDPTRLHVFGQDFARNMNLTSITVLCEGPDLVRRPVLQLELFNCPFSSQEQILFHLVDHLPRFRGGAMDAGGNGSAMAEKTAQRYGTQMVERVMLSSNFYRDHMPKLKAALEDGTLDDIPRDAQLRDDLRAVRVVDGVPKIKDGDSATSGAAKAAAKEMGAKMKRHGDFAVSLFLALYAFTRECGAIDWTPIPANAGRWAEGTAAGGRKLQMRSRAAEEDAAAGMGAARESW